MKLLHSIQTENFHEIKIQRSFIFLKWSATYHKFNDGVVLRYSRPCHYYTLGLWEYAEIKPLFSIKKRRAGAGL